MLYFIFFILSLEIFMSQLLPNALHMQSNGATKYLLGSHDIYSNFVRFTPLKRLDSKSVYKGLLDIYKMEYLPNTIRVDCAASFTSSEFKSLLANAGTYLIPTIPYRSKGWRQNK